MKAGGLLLGVDVGGTTIAAGAVTAAGEVLLEQRVPTRDRGPGHAVEVIGALIDELCGEASRLGRALDGIGVGVPGPVDAVAGRVGEPVPHVPELAGRALAAELSERFRLPTFVDNDVNALALAE